MVYGGVIRPGPTLEQGGAALHCELKGQNGLFTYGLKPNFNCPLAGRPPVGSLREQFLRLLTVPSVPTDSEKAVVMVFPLISLNFVLSLGGVLGCLVKDYLLFY